MAATRLIAMHINKGQTAEKSLKNRTDYAKNEEKTEKGELVTAYECNAQIADQEFMSARSEYLKNHRANKNDILAYQIRQSFKPGEITPEEANQVGYETAMRFTKGNHAFIVATHTDKAHIHNHIIFNSVNLNCDRKFRDFLFSAIALQKVSDLVCLEHGLSVIQQKKPSERVKRTTYPKRESCRDEIRKIIDQVLAGNPKDFEDFLKLLQEENYEVKRGKNIAVRGNSQKRFIRLSSLGAAYTEEDIKKRITGEFVRTDENNVAEKSENKKRDFDLLINIQDIMAKGKGAGYERWAKVYNVKQVAKALLFLQEHNIHDLAELQEKADTATEKFHQISESIKDAEKYMDEISNLKKHIINYSKTRDVYVAYRKTGYSKKFFEEHRQEILLHKAAKDLFNEVPEDLKKNGKIPTIKELSEEFASHLANKKSAYSQYHQAKQEMQDYLIAKQDIEKILGAERQEQEQKKEKKQEQSL